MSTTVLLVLLLSTMTMLAVGAIVIKITLGRRIAELEAEKAAREEEDRHTVSHGSIRILKEHDDAG